MTPIFGPITLEEMSANTTLTKIVMPLIANACEHSGGRFTLDTVVEGLIAKRLSLWGVLAEPANFQAVAVSRVGVWESGLKIFEVLMLGGPKFKAVMPFLEELKKRAAAAGCVKALLYGHIAWAGGRLEKRSRILPEGWRASAMIYECDLNAARQA